MNTMTTEEFVVEKVNFCWIIKLDIDVHPEVMAHLYLSNKNTIQKVITESGFGHIKHFRPDYYKLKYEFMEELKACLRKRSKLKGNVKYPFLLYREKKINLDIKIAISCENKASLLIKTKTISGSFSPKETMFLSTIPNDQNKQVHFAITKLAQALSTGDIYSRSKSLEFDSYPFIEVTQYSPRNESLTIMQDVPWHILTTIGERHLDLPEKSNPIVQKYKDSNYTIRNDVCVFKKQSTLVVRSAEKTKNYIEYDKYIHITLVLFQMKQSLDALAQKTKSLSTLNTLPILESLEFMYKHPSAVGKSFTMESIWVKICDVTEIMDKVSYIKGLITAPDDIPSKLNHLLSQIEAHEEDTSLEDARLILELYETDIKSAWLKARVVLEEFVANIIKLEAKKVPNQEQLLKKTLDDQINHLRIKKVIPDDIAAFMNTIRLFGNIGGHGGKVIYCPSQLALIHIIQALNVIFDWYLKHCIRCYLTAHDTSKYLSLNELAESIVKDEKTMVWKNSWPNWKHWSEEAEISEFIKRYKKLNKVSKRPSPPPPPPPLPTTHS